MTMAWENCSKDVSEESGYARIFVENKTDRERPDAGKDKRAEEMTENEMFWLRSN